MNQVSMDIMLNEDTRNNITMFVMSTSNSWKFTKKFSKSIWRLSQWSSYKFDIDELDTIYVW